MKEKDFLENNEFISYMLSKDSNGEHYWQSYLDKHPQDRASFIKAKRSFQAVRFQKAPLSDKERDLLYCKIVQGATQKKRLRRRKIGVNVGLAVAASVLFMLLIKFKTEPQVHPTAVLVQKAKTTNKIELIIHNKAYTLNNNDTLNVTKAGRINLGNTFINTKEDTSYNTLKVPFGKKTQVTLADGSKLWVNAGTVVKFPSSFQKDKRTIYVDGEIYIEVTKDKSRPFIVETSNFNVQVYGTIFDVKAYKNNTTQKVVLVEGSVGVTTADTKMMMKPSEMVVFDAQRLTKSKVEVANHISWQKGYLTFMETTLEEVLTELSRYYNVTFSEISDDVKGNVCTGKIFLSENLEDVLETLETLTDTSFQMEKK